MGGVREWMGRVSTLVYRQAREKMMLEGELEKSKLVQQSMRNEVIQLKEMINEAMNGYAKELETKNDVIRALQTQLQQRELAEQRQREEEEEKVEREAQFLEIIQEESEQSTLSSASLREFKEDEVSEQSVSPSLSQQQSRILVNDNDPANTPEATNTQSPVLQNSSRIV